MSLFTRVAAAFTAEEKPTESTIDHSWWNSSRFLILPAFGLFLWYGHTIFSIWTILILAGLAALYMLTNTWSKIHTINANKEIILARDRLAWADGILTPDEAKAIEAGKAALDAPPGA
jgi:maltodextrin utilization protein YvdJ